MSNAPETSSTVRTILNKAIWILETISSGVILIMMIITFADVIGRYVFNKPIFGGTEIIAALLALAIFSGLGVINARDDHIVVELLEAPARKLVGPLAYEVSIQIFSVACMSLIAVVLFAQAWESYEYRKLTVVLEMPVYYVTGTVAVLAVISVISQVTGVALKIMDLGKQKKADAL
jgi:TRAP-type C4-dicarboxylate transport system permease small subunit